MKRSPRAQTEGAGPSQYAPGAKQQNINRCATVTQHLLGKLTTVLFCIRQGLTHVMVVRSSTKANPS